MQSSKGHSTLSFPLLLLSKLPLPATVRRWEEQAVFLEWLPIWERVSHTGSLLLDLEEC